MKKLLPLLFASCSTIRVETEKYNTTTTVVSEVAKSTDWNCAVLWCSPFVLSLFLLVYWLFTTCKRSIYGGIY
jgi:hypothetical protein